MMHPKFTIAEIGSTIIIIDDCLEGCRSVTNDIDFVLMLIDSNFSLSEKEVVYRDSDKIYAGVLLDEKNHFVDFVNLGNHTDLFDCLFKLKLFNQLSVATFEQIQKKNRLLN